ncbi:hypothetical protein [Hymenobacter rubripertinctus]|uniref:Lipoprotein n=1 Tax=Hymenobacter rubripertinctus TaxID=2029981 RepID=A0A418QVQ3_9BACT|nr:hypothetical protein [Hymenobacter rubripertinctus]RIY09296.1 hypothetical protein D0T11_12785 [Hymenobacter rubripertinctus]
MKHYLLAAALLPALAACHNSDKDDAAPAAIAAGFSQDFALHYRQQATLPTAQAPELTVLVEDLQFSICPKNTNCLLPDFAAPTLAITAADGSTQQLKLPRDFSRDMRPAWIDTAGVRANGRRYVVYYRNWSFDAAKQDNPQKQDFTISLRVERP